MTNPAIALQLYSIRDLLGDDPLPALERVAAAGFDRIEPFDVARLAPTLGPAMRAAGITASTTHAGVLGDDADAVLAAAASLGADTVIEPYTPAERWTSRDDVLRVADALNTAGEQAAAHGLRLGYHNHAWEAQPVEAGRTGLEVLADALDPAIVLEVDAYWAAIGGADVPALLHALGDRVVALHLKDAPLVDGALAADTIDQLPVGEGAIDWRSIVDAAPAAELLVVEFDAYRGDLLDGAAASLAGIRALVEGKTA